MLPREVRRQLRGSPKNWVEPLAARASAPRGLGMGTRRFIRTVSTPIATTQLHPPSPLPQHLDLQYEETHNSNVERQTVADELRALGARRKLVRAAELGFIQELRCAMPVCFHPDPNPVSGFYPDPNPDSDGRGFFEMVLLGPPWVPTPDHYPVLKYQGGRLTPNNIRLAHKLCNALDWQRNPIHADARAANDARNAAAAVQWAKDHPRT